MANFFDKFDGATAPVPAAPALPGLPAGVDLTQPMAPAALQAAAAPPAPVASSNFFDKFDTSAPGPAGPVDQHQDITGGYSLSAPKEGLWDRIKDTALDAVHHSPAGALTNWVSGLLPATEDYVGGGDNSTPALQARAQARTVQSERDYRDQYAGATHDDPWRRPEGTTLGNAARFGADAIGTLGGGLIADPTNMIAPGETFLTKLLGQGAIGAVGDAAQQGVELKQGVRDKFDPGEVALSGAGGAATVGTIEAVPALRAWLRTRGVNADYIPDDQLVAGSLDGGVHPDVEAALRTAGADPAQFSSPDLANAAAARAAAAQARSPVRAVPPDVSMIAAPEGTIRSDDAGAIAGVERSRAADQGVLSEAQRKVADDPLVSTILDSNLSSQAKIATLWDRLSQMKDRHEANGETAPWMQPTADDAAAGVARAVNPDRARMHDITVASESGGDPNAVSPKGARGLMQVLDDTNGDPGFGVRPAQNATPAERARVGRDYLDAMMSRYGDDPAKAWAAYNWGPGHMDAAVRAFGDDWLKHAPAETQSYVRKNLGQMGAQAPEALWRMAAPDGDTIAGPYSGRSKPISGDTSMGDFEDPLAKTSPTLGELKAGVGKDQEAPLQVGGSDRLFRSPTDDPQGQPGFWEDRARRQHQDAFAQSQADLEAEWQRRADQQHEQAASAGGRFERERTQAGADASTAWAGRYDQKPIQAGDAWRMTDDGHIAGKDGNPVAFRNPREAAQFAAKNELGGDFELASWGANSKRVVLRRREGSSYGVPGERVTPGPAEPAAGRSVDESQRSIAAPHDERLEPAEPVASQLSLDEAERANPSPLRDLPAPNERDELPSYRLSPGAPVRRDPIDLVGWLRQQGGVRDNAGELAARGMDNKPRSIEFAKSEGFLGPKLVDNEKGMTLDDAAHAAWENGFFPGHAERPTVSEFLDAIEETHEGGPGRVFHPDDHPNIEQYRAAQRQRNSVEWAQERGSPLAEDVGRPVEPADLDARQPPPEADAAHLKELKGRGPTLFARARDEGLGRDRPASRPLADDLRTLAAGQSNTHGRRLAAQLADLVGDAEVKYGGDLGEGVRGTAHLDGEGRASASVAHASDPEALLHEAVHVATLSRYGELRDGATAGKAVDPHVQALEQLRARAQKAFARRSVDPNGQIAHALGSTDEFLAGGLTSPAVQGFLKQHSAAGLWGRFVDGVRSILGASPRYGSLLDHVLQHGASIIEKMPQDRPGRAAEGATLFSKAHEPVDAEKPGEAGWKRIGGLIFERDLMSHDGPALVGAIKSVFGEPKAALHAIGDRLKQFGEASAYSADSALRSMAGRFDAPTIAKVADLFHAEASKASGTDRTYYEAIARQNGRFANDLHSALKPHLENEAAMSRIRDLLATPNKTVRATPAEREAAGTVRDLLKEVLEYRKDAGEDIGEVGDGYFPRRLRADKVAADPTGFAKKAEQLYSAIGVDDAKGAADAWLLRTMDSHAGISDGLQFAGSSGGSSAKSREFGKQADVLLRDFYETNPLRALSDYVTGSVKRAEEARRFGPVGRAGSAEREAWTEKHGDRGQWDVMKDQIKAELRAKGGDATGVMERIDGIRSTNLGRMRPGSVRTGAVISTIHAWNQLSTLANATIASLPEMAMGFVRGGPRFGFGHFTTTMQEFVRNVRKLPPSDAKRYAEAAGAVSAESAVDLLRARADDPMASTVAQKLLHSFYRKNGLEQWTDAGRTAAVRTGQRFVDALAHDLESTDARTKNRAAGYLRELGVQDPAGFGRQVRAGAPSIDDMRGDKGFAGQYATALLRFANQSVLLPTRAEKPTWASHPLGSLLFALQSYNYGFKKNVLDRVGRQTMQAVKERDPAKLAPAAGLALLTGVTAMVQGMRHTIDGPPAGSEDEGAFHYALETLDRAGMFGAMSPIINGIEGLKYRRSVADSLQGAVIGRVADAVDAVGGLAIGNTDKTNSAERKAAGAVYDTVVKPTIDAVGAGVLKGPLGSAAILGSGKRPGSILPSDREAFVSSLAGAKQEKPEPEGE